MLLVITKAYIFYIIANMGKETCLLFIFMFLSMTVNDRADDITTDIYEWSPIGSGEDDVMSQRLQRLELIVQATTFNGPRAPSFRTSVWGRTIGDQSGPIGFRVLGVRWTSRAVWTILLSFIATMVSVVYKTLV